MKRFLFLILLLIPLIGQGQRVSDRNSDAVIVEIAGGGSSDWSDPEKEQIRDALGVDGAKTASTGGVLQTVLKKIKLAIGLSA